MKAYLQKLYDARFFWIHLARIELKNKFRRSKLGILWTFISPLCLTAIMSFVLSVAFKSDIVQLAPYILSGLLVWDLINTSFQAGGSVIVANDAYIRQFNHPITMYTLKSAIVYTISFLISTTALILWTAVVNPVYLLPGIVSLPLTAFCLFFLSWAVTTIAAYVNTRYRDYPQVIALVLQMVWYLSPVFFQESMFENSAVLLTWFQINPITHILYLVRKPFLYGRFADPVDYLFLLGTIAACGAFAYWMNRRNEKTIVFYI